MSADLTIHDPHAPGSGAELNVTYNLSAMLHEAGFKGWQWTQGKPARRVGRHILTVLTHMSQDPDHWRSLNPPNGWGDYDTCIQGRMREWAILCTIASKKATIEAWL